MLRLGGIFVIICMVLIAACLGAVLYLMLGLNGVESTVVAASILTVLVVTSASTARLRERGGDSGAQIADLSRGTADIARQVAELARRTEALEAERGRIVDSAAEKARVANEPLSAELGELGALVKQLAETVTSHELRLLTLQKDAFERPAQPLRPVAEPAEIMVEPAPEVMAAPSPFGAAAPQPAAAPPAAVRRLDMIEPVRSAIEANRVDLYLQPIVTLPQRKVRYYEAFTRLRTEDGVVMQPIDFIGPAEAGGLMPRIDNMLLLRSVQVVRRLQLKNRDIGLFCNIAASTLNEPQLFLQILQFMDANRALAPSLVLEFKQSVLQSIGPMETESLAALRDLGFRFCMDQVTDLRMEPRDLGERGIRYVKVPAALLLGQAHSPSADIHAADLSDLLGRFGISLIAERIEAETQVVDLLEYDVRFGQGFLFSQPRPVRQEALRGSADRAGSEGSESPRDKVAAGGSAGFPL
jgi:cyclic-di-GMP phosphodiesterase TipF (flagellum assembly factor)